MDKLVVVLSRNYSTGLSVIRSLGEAGYTVDLIASALKEGRSLAISKSKYIRNAVEVVSQKVDNSEDTDLLNELLAYKDQFTEKPVLIPTDDYTASVMDTNRTVLEDIFFMPGITVEGEKLTTYMDKSIQCRIAEEAGVPAPKCWVVSLRERPVQIPDDMVYPCFCKPLESFTGYKQEMARCNDREELSAHLDSLSEKFSERSFLIQEFIDIDNEIDIEGVSLDQEAILTGVVWKSIVAGYERGVPLAGEFMPFDRFPGLEEKVRELLKRYHYRGMFDLGINIVGDEYYFNEINLRSGGTNFVYFSSGVNLPDLFVKETLGVPHGPEEETPVFGKKYFYEKEGYEDLLHDILSEEEFNEWNEKADIKFFVNDKDPEPGEIFIGDMEKRRRKKAVREEQIALVMSETGWSRGKTEETIKEVCARLDIKRKEYVRYKLWNVEQPEDLEAEYKKRFERRERKKQQRESCLQAVIADTGMERDDALAMVRAAREKTGISFKDYEKYTFWKVPEEEQEAKYLEIEQHKEIIKRNREECVQAAMEDMGWTREEALEKIKDARKRTGISYKDYKNHHFWKVPEEKQQLHYEKLVLRKK